MARSKTFDIVDYSGGMNNYADSRDIKDNEFAQLLNCINIRNGQIRTGYQASDLHTNLYPTNQSAITIADIKTKNLVSFKNDFTALLAEENTEYLIYSDGNRLYRLEYSGSSWAWQVLNDLGGTSIVHPAIVIYDGNIRYSDGSHTISSSSPYLGTNQTKFWGVVRRKYFNATTNDVSEITGLASTIKPTDGSISFNSGIETSANNPTRGFIGLEVNKVENTPLDEIKFGTASAPSSPSTGPNSTYFSLEKDDEFAEIGSLLIDINSNTLSNSVFRDTESNTEQNLASITSAGSSEIQFNSSGYLEIGDGAGNDSDLATFTITIDEGAINNEYGTTNRSLKIQDALTQSGTNVDYSFLDYAPIIKPVVNGVVGSAFTITSTYNSVPTEAMFRFSDPDKNTKYQVQLKAGANEQMRITSLQIFNTLKPLSKDATTAKFADITAGGTPQSNGHTFKWNSILNPAAQDIGNLIEIRCAIPFGNTKGTSKENPPDKIEFYFATDTNVNNYKRYVLDEVWISENKGKGWVDVIIDLQELSDDLGTSTIGTLDTFAVYLYKDSYNSNSSNRIMIDRIRQTNDFRGSWDGNFKFYYSWIYDRSQESGYYEFDNQGSGIKLDSNRLSSKVLIRELSNGGFGARGKRITGANIYFKEYDVDRKEEMYDDPFLLLKCDFERGVTKSRGTSINEWSSGTTATDHYTHNSVQFIDPPLAKTFSINAGYDYDPLNTIEEIRFRDAVSLNRRMYYGNVDIHWEKYEGETTNRRNRYGDRIYKSLPNRPDVIPSTNFLEVDVNDGDEVTALATYADRLLVYKEQTMYLINATKNLEYLEDTHKYKGVYSNRAVCYTDYGVAWANTEGAYHYDGQKVVNLIDKKLERGQYLVGLTNGLGMTYPDNDSEFSIAYEANHRHLLIINNAGEGWVYNFVSDSWSQIDNGINVSNFKRTNIEFHKKFLRVGSINTSTDTASFHQYLIGSGTNATSFDIKTKDFGITDIGQKKDIKAIYVTYKGTMDSTKKVVVEYFADKSSTAVALSPSELSSSANGFTTIKLTPSPKSGGRRVHSIQVRVKSAGSAGASYDFELHDISVIYREKSIK